MYKKKGNTQLGNEQEFPDLMTPDESTRVLKVCKNNIGKLVQKGKLPAWRFGVGIVRIITSDLGAIVMEHIGAKFGWWSK